MLTTFGESKGALTIKIPSKKPLSNAEITKKDKFSPSPIHRDVTALRCHLCRQKAVAVLLALLALGVKGIRLGPTLPAFLSPNVATVLVKNFDIKPTGQVAEDVAAIMAGK